MAKRGLDAQSQDASAVEIARQALQSELSDPVAPFHTPRHEGDLFASEQNPVEPNQRGKVIRQLDPHAYDPVAIWTVTDTEKARQIMGILETAGIECYLGPDNVENLDDFKGDYEAGVEIKVMKFQARFAQDGLRRVVPPDPEEQASDAEEFSISCPKCNSPDVIFVGLVEGDGKDTAAKANNSWTCDACGHQWEDDGIEGRV
jgi:DNA-directed RNA polymerase subunit M/transcription elongation factor TFIIS